MSDNRVYHVVNHHGTVQFSTLEAKLAFDHCEELKAEYNTNLYEVKSYKLEGTNNG